MPRKKAGTRGPYKRPKGLVAKLEGYRLMHELTYKELAERLGVEHSYCHRVMTGQRPVTDRIRQAAAALGIIDADVGA